MRTSVSSGFGSRLYLQKELKNHKPSKVNLLSENTLLRIQKESTSKKEPKKEKKDTSNPTSTKNKKEKSFLNDTIISSIQSQHEFEQNYDSNYGFDSTYNLLEDQPVGFTNIANQNPKSITLKLKSQLNFHAKQFQINEASHLESIEHLNEQISLYQNNPIP